MLVLTAEACQSFWEILLAYQLKGEEKWADLGGLITDLRHEPRR